MAWKLIWSPVSRMDLRSIVAFIRRDSLRRAETFGYRLILEAEKLIAFPRRGRVVPEFHDEAIREIVVRPYRTSIASAKNAGLWKSSASGTARVANLT